MKNKLIVLEGIDGVGKTRLAKALVQELRKRKHPAVRYESLENKIKGFNRLKPFIKSNVSPDSSLLFYLASAIHKSENIKKLLKRKWVVCDRYLYSTLASHKARGANLSLINWRKLPIIKPDYLFLIVVKDEIRLARVKKRKKINPADLIRKDRFSQPYLMERELKKFKPIVIDNSSEFIKTLERILSYIE